MDVFFHRFSGLLPVSQTAPHCSRFPSAAACAALFSSRRFPFLLLFQARKPATPRSIRSTVPPITSFIPKIPFPFSGFSDSSGEGALSSDSVDVSSPVSSSSVSFISAIWLSRSFSFKAAILTSPHIPRPCRPFCHCMYIEAGLRRLWEQTGAVL